MSKLLAILFATLTIGSAQAKETVTIMYAFSPADSMANYSRTLVIEANKLQDKYTFVFDTKPGAGGAIAAMWGKANPTNGIVMTSSAFFIRPNFYPNESHDIADFKELLPECNAPIAVSSVKYKSWKEVPKDKTVTIGVSGLGVTTHLVATQLQRSYPNLTVVPFKSTTDALLSMVGGNTDFSIGFLGEPENWGKDTSKVKVVILGITGNKSIHGHPTLISEGFPKIIANLNAPHHLIVNNKVPDDKFNEYRAILVKAAKTKSVQDSYAVDSCEPLNSIPDSEIQPWFHMQNSRWKQLTYGVKIN
jgi:tripartite-type tricarboxylate transporter receptor subunit TctC